MDFDLSNVHPLLAMPVHRDLAPETVMSLLQTQGEMQRRNFSLSLDMSNGSSLIAHGRTAIAVDFLKSSCTHLFWVDSDIVWQADDFVRLLALGTKLECVCAAYPVKQDKVEFFIGFPDKRTQRDEYGCLPINGTGLGFCCIQRKVIEQLAERAPQKLYHGRLVPELFRCDTHNNELRGEDHAFFADVRDLGYGIHLYPDITLGHVGRKVYTASVWECLKTEAA